MTLFEREPANKIKEIWAQYYSEKPNAVGWDIPAGELDLLVNNGVSNPFFIFPVRKHSGYYMLLAQNQEKSFIYTYLEDYKKDPNNATPYLVITMFDELAFKKGLGLVRGDIIGDISKKEAEVIFKLTRDFYSQESLYRNVTKFNRESHKFDFQQHIDQSLKYYNI